MDERDFSAYGIGVNGYRHVAYTARARRASGEEKEVAGLYFAAAHFLPLGVLFGGRGREF